ncbi:uncharacterized protein LTHEOB_5525 [Lasiodiplodia theobromae]|uniref:Uncharacterized protein n=1 Tax=Lasiodiplodia theobromae TaxID=45133 RepID=A0A5N5DFY1_9PEZI|nr:uncharacterized protein LTHEOB_5525 [Lasiodiplodia theobromae]KAB2575952.1 hypothetical protein DBV05_g5461 [Lasiodiplodia theobromae]KAF4545114.1 hypothetical protein LTHEOB_5525 [Lasiodiplodia theobromae]
MSAHSDARFIKRLYGDKWGFLVFVTVASADPDPAHPDGQQLPERARLAVQKINDYIARYLYGRDEPYDEQLLELMDWTVIPLPGADQAAIRDAFRSHLTAMNEGRDPDEVQIGRMCLVVDDEVVNSVERGPEPDDDEEDELEHNVFVKVLDVGHPPGTSEVVAARARGDDPRHQICYEGWIKSTPRALFQLYEWGTRNGWSYERFCPGPSEIHDW